MARKPYHRGPVSGHFDGTRFFNPGQESTDRTLGEILRWKWRGGAAAWPAAVAVPAVVPERRVDGLAVTMIGHASVLVQLGGLNLLVDPVWSERASPVRFAGPRRATRPGVAFEDLPPIDAVLLTHNHYDHMDTATLARLDAAHRPRVIAPLGNAAVLPGLAVEEADWGDRLRLSDAVSVTLHPATHWSARGLGDRRMALWCGFVLEAAAGPVYLAGDTAFGDGALFDQVQARFGAPALAVLPIGAYEPRWFMRPQHMDPDEAVQAMLRTGARQALGVHWGTFQLTDEAREAPVAALREACARHGVEFGRFEAFEPGTRWCAPGRTGLPGQGEAE